MEDVAVLRCGRLPYGSNDDDPDLDRAQSVPRGHQKSILNVVNFCDRWDRISLTILENTKVPYIHG